jgi:hypothetical protein
VSRLIDRISPQRKHHSDYGVLFRSELVKDVVKPAVGVQGPDVFTTGEEEVEVAEE